MSQPSLNLGFLSLQKMGNTGRFGNFRGSVNATKDNNGIKIIKNDDITKEHGMSRTSVDKITKSAAKEVKDLKKQIRADINPAPMLSVAMLFKWNYKVGGTVLDIVDFKTGKVIAQVPPEQVLEIMT